MNKRLFFSASIFLVVWTMSFSAQCFAAEEAQAEEKEKLWEPTAKPGYVLKKETIGDRGILAYTLSKEGAESKKRPAVILIHGGAVEDPILRPGCLYKEIWFINKFEHVPYRLAEKGMLVVSIDTWWAESRFDPAYETFVRANYCSAILHGWVEGTRDVSQTVDWLEKREDVDPDRIGVAGKSGGGFTSLMAACQEPRLAAVVAWKGAGDFEKGSRMRGFDELIEKSLQGDPNFKTELEKYDPINAYSKIPPKPVAIIGNRDDPLVAAVTLENVHAKLLPLYKEFPEKLKFLLVDTDEPTHDDQKEALVAGCEWLEKYLLQE